MVYDSLQHRIIANSIQVPYTDYAGTPCWFWMGTRNNYGYGTISLRWQRGPRKGQTRKAYAHRMSVIAFKNRRLSPRQVVMHLCNSPWCVNPDHLVGGTQKKNVQQCVKEGRHKSTFYKKESA